MYFQIFKFWKQCSKQQLPRIKWHDLFGFNSLANIHKYKISFALCYQYHKHASSWAKLDSLARDALATDALEAKITGGDMKSMHQALSTLKPIKKFQNNKILRITDKSGKMATSVSEEKASTITSAKSFVPKTSNRHLFVISRDPIVDSGSSRPIGRLRF